MSNQTQSSEAKSDKSNKSQVEQTTVAEQRPKLAGLSELPGSSMSATGDGTVAKQADLLTDPNIQIAQRRAMAAQIGQAQGDQHLQRVINVEAQSKDECSRESINNYESKQSISASDSARNSARYHPSNTVSPQVKPNVQTQNARRRPTAQRQPTHAVEVHVNLQGTNRVRVYRRGESPIEFPFVSAGRSTFGLIRDAPYHVIEKRTPPTKKVGKWGLQYFVRFLGGFGFHSNITYPRSTGRRKKILGVTGSPISHGCIRMRHSDAIHFYNLVSVGTPIRIYRRKKWHNPSWSR
jgi:lipoprotein-anchoring transpeptidase ErfK/SrfK